MAVNKKTIRIDNDGNWTFKVRIKTYDTKGYNAVPYNLASKFLTMEVYDISGAVLASASTDASNTAMANALSGIAILDEVNRNKPVHVITLEDPIEYSHEHKMATFNQRELGADFDTFTSGLRAALRGSGLHAADRVR